MKQYTPKERLYRVLHHQEVDRMPSVCFTQTATLDQMDKINVYWPEAHDDPEKMALLAEAAHTIIGLEAIRVPFDITAEAEFFGCELKQGTKEQQPSVISHSIKELKDIEKYKDFRFGENTRCDHILKAIQIISKKYSDLPILGSMIGPFSLAQHLNGDNWFMSLLTNDSLVVPLIELTTNFCIEYSKKMIENGADTIIVIDPTASYELLGEEFYKNFVMPYHKRIVDALSQYNNISTVLHICGDTTEGIELMDQAKFNAISVDQKVNLEVAISKSKNGVIVGNLDPVQLLWRGTPELIKKQSSLIYSKGVKIVTAGCGIVSISPTENLQAMAQFAKDTSY